MSGEKVNSRDEKTRFEAGFAVSSHKKSFYERRRPNGSVAAIGVGDTE